MEKKAKRIDFRIKIAGKGLINYDDKEQKFMFKTPDNSGPKHHLWDPKNNTNYAKKNFYRDTDGKLQYKLKISSNCLIHHIFENDIVGYNTSLAHHPELLMNFIASPIAVIRGFMVPKSDGKSSLKKKSPFNITDAEEHASSEENFSTSCLEFFSRSGKKQEKSGDTDVKLDDKDTTIFSRETAGNIIYESEGSVDLKELQFVSLDDIYDRLAFSPDMFAEFKKIMQRRMPNFNSETGFYTMKTGVFQFPEYGFTFSNENTNFMVKELFKRILSFYVSRRSGKAEILSLEYKVITDPVDHIGNKNSGWVSLKNSKDIEKIEFEMEEIYQQEDENKSMISRKVIEDSIDSQKMEKREAKKEAASKKAKAKEATA